MSKKAYRNILMLVVATGVLITATQAYFTWQHYQVNKQRFINDVQIALDLSVEQYVSDKARNSLRVFRVDMVDTVVDGQKASAMLSAVDSIGVLAKRLQTDGLANGNNRKLSYLWLNNSAKADTLKLDSLIKHFNTANIDRVEVLNKIDVEVCDDDDEQLNRYEQLTRKVMLSVNEDLLDLGKLYKTVQEELARKQLTVGFALQLQTGSGTTSVGTRDDSYLSTVAKSSYWGTQRTVTMDFENATLAILQRGLTDLAISVLLVGWVMGAMLYLYNTINKQKQIATIKDDLISNITHEFKTPIATINSALEGIIHFNTDNDPEKTRRYLSISTDQLTRLNGMVEKLLETAAIDKGKLALNREETELVGWTHGIVERFRLVAGEKALSFEYTTEQSFASIDPFHLENTVANLIDNAIKYGGDCITVRFFEQGDEGQATWEVEDNGGHIAKADEARIFEKLYRIPTGNQHDVKGFGIGLFYARSIAELHGGTLSLAVAQQKTIFTLQL